MRASRLRTAFAGTAAACMLSCAGEPLQVATDQELAAAIAGLTFGGADTVLVASGDIARCQDLAPAAATARIVDAVIAVFPAARVLTTGDHAYEDGTRIEFERCYAPTWGRFNERTAPTPGNHDYESDDAAPYYDYFAYYRNDEVARARGYYSFDVGDWHVVSLNSMVAMEAKSPQLRWLEADLAAADATCLLAYWHHPRFTSGLHGLQLRDNGRSTDTFWDVLSDYDADLIVNGHSHMYERFARQTSSGDAAGEGIPQFVVGTGGAELDRAFGRRDNSRYLIDRAHGVFVLALHDGSYDWAFVGVDGVVYDRSSVSEPCERPHASAPRA